MSTILICDDDKAFVEYLAGEILRVMQALQRQVQLYRCHRAQDITPQMMDECDIAFLDIDFAGKKYTGIDIARRLRRHSARVVIIFVTSYPEYAPDGYEVHAFRYLLKSRVKSKLRRYLSEALEQVCSTKPVYAFPVGGSTVTLALEDIVYIESQLHTVNVYIREPGSEQPTAKNFYAAISQLEVDLKQEGFLRIHKSYLVNMRYLEKFQCAKATLTDGTVLKVSQKNYAEQKPKYLQWKGI